MNDQAVEVVGMTKKVTVSVFDGAQHFRDYEFEQDAITIGRKESNSIVLAKIAVSGVHAKIDLLSMTLTDLGSMNGTFLGDQQISTVPLEYNRPFKIGEYRIIVTEYSSTNRHGDDALTLNLKNSSFATQRSGDAAQTVFVKGSPIADGNEDRIGEVAAAAPVAQGTATRVAWIVALVLVAALASYYLVRTAL
jgi:hypothetical protein